MAKKVEMWPFADLVVPALASWLQQELAKLQIEDFDLDVLGFSEEEIAKLLDPEGINKAVKEYEGSEEFGEDEFSEFEHKCPRCGFEFNGKG